MRGKQEIYLAIDGNRTGAQLERYILGNDMDGLHNFSNMISVYLGSLMEYIEQNSGTVYMAGGDNLLAKINSSFVLDIYDMLASALEHGFAFSMAVGESPIDTYLGLKYAKCLNELYISVSKSPYGEIEFRRFDRDVLLHSYSVETGQ